jgi:hypothetical protein
MVVALMELGRVVERSDGTDPTWTVSTELRHLEDGGDGEHGAVAVSGERVFRHLACTGKELELLR